MEIQNKLYKAAIEGDVQTLESLLEEDPLTLHRVVHVSTFRDTPLHVSVLRGHLEFTRVVVKHNPSLACEQDLHGNTPLHVAAAASCAGCHAEMVRELVAHAEEACSSACMVRNRDGRVPVELAVMRGSGGGDGEVVMELVKVSKGVINGVKGLFHLCVEYGNMDGLKVLIEEFDGVQEDVVNVRDDNGNSLLHLAAYYKNLEIVKYLLSQPGIDPNAVNNRGETPVSMIQNCPRDIQALEVINFLLQSTTPRTNNDNNQTPTPLTPQQQNPNPKPTSQNKKKKSWKKFFTFNGENTDKLEQMRGALFIASAIVVVINVIPVFFIQIYNEKSYDLTGDFSTSVLSMWSALIVMIILMSGVSLRNPICAWLVVQLTYTMLAFLSLYYVANLISNEYNYVNVGTPAILIFVWYLMLLVLSLVNLIRLVAWFVKVVKRNGKRKEKIARENDAMLKA